MHTRDFYSIIDGELDAFIARYKDDSVIKAHKRATNNQKSYALLIWFLDFYGRVSNYSNFITDGGNDSSCDIVFDSFDNQGNKIFYVLQSKWNNADNSERETEKDEILKALSDFETILRGEKKSVNNKLKSKLEELDLHLKANGAVKFIFLSLSQYKGGADENIEAFKNNDVKTKFEVIDIDRIRVDYIDRKYKKIDPVNPLETYQNPEESSIGIEIVQKGGSVKIEKPYEAYMFLLRPKSIWELFKTYNFLLFFKNVRNPLLQSQFNEDIEKTILEESSLFWYYNNGITAITKILPEIGKKAETITVTGLQIINGAQTVYSIYRAYERASHTQRIQMDTEAVITLRLLKSGGKNFDLNVTRYTNSQNPVQDRDFCANDEVQIALQNASYKTNVWYEKRRGEYREVPKGVKTIPNGVFANLYLAYHLQDPVSVIKNYELRVKTGKDLNFISHRDHKDGLYERIFNSKTSFEDMLSAFYVFDTVFKPLNKQYSFSLKTNLYHLLALFKVAFTKYLKVKYGDKINVNKQVIKIYEKGDKGEKETVIKTFKFLSQFVERQVGGLSRAEKTSERMLKFLFTLSHYQKIYDALEEAEISTNDIDDVILKDDDEIIDSDRDNESTTDEE
ncbi:MAG: abortive phage infection protein [Bacteroidetes bacterium]|nr:MAG: abortive phage infection protein [Bacteroidota bacterium]